MVARNDKGQFCKGDSGNPGGRPKSELSITALIDDAVTADDWKQIILALKKRALRGDLKAIEMLADRRFGKAIQAINQSNSGEVKVIVEYARRTPGA